MENKPQTSVYDPISIEVPPDMEKLLLHSCCAPCAGEVMETLLFNKVKFSVLFYNPNIHPQKEYLLRKNENIDFARHHGVEFIDADYDTKNWFARTDGMENEPERGARCTVCFDMRFEYTARYAQRNGYSHYSSSLGISRWKDMSQINESGVRVAQSFPPVHYWTYNWRKRGGASRMIEISKREGFYQQEYCGCVYSLRDTNRSRCTRGMQRIRIGQRYYGDGTPSS
ncbi:MAG: epoxyqueuosine reductase QueH [Gammaproteobacteria bacterium]|nr:epoxyqueuosine reductase QueH [Pseudomonadota bacterium]MCH9662496.1 epoxyqueuosine reductase QueH [Gammaproteobacteria bacterium]